MRVFKPYRRLQFPAHANRPHVYANFVMSLDGTVASREHPDAYRTIGSATDREALFTLRAQADILVHGRRTAEQFNTLKALDAQDFRRLRTAYKKPLALPYLIVSADPTAALLARIQPQPRQIVYLATTNAARIPKKVARDVTILRCGKKEIDFVTLMLFLHTQGYRNALLEGGPTLMGSLLKERLVDELLLTIAPKIFGNNNDILTMIEGHRFPADHLPRASLITVHHEKDELFVCYKLRYD